jgi:hypothetical protein
VRHLRAMLTFVAIVISVYFFLYLPLAAAALILFGIGILTGLALSLPLRRWLERRARQESLSQ